MKLFTPEPVDDEHGAAPGTVVATHSTRGVAVAASEGTVWLGEVQPPGKRRMPAGDWLR